MIKKKTILGLTIADIVFSIMGMYLGIITHCVFRISVNQWEFWAVLLPLIVFVSAIRRLDKKESKND